MFILCWSPYILFDLLQVSRLILHSLQSSSQTPAIGEVCSNADILTISLMQTMLMLMLMLKLLLVDLLFILVMLFQTCAGLQSHPIFPCSRHLHPVPRPTQLRSKPPHLLPLLSQYWSDSDSTFRISIREYSHSTYIQSHTGAGKCLQRLWCRRHCPCCSTPDDDLLGSAGLRTTSTGSTLLSRWFSNPKPSILIPHPHHLQSLEQCCVWTFHLLWEQARWTERQFSATDQRGVNCSAQVRPFFGYHSNKLLLTSRF